jgi:F-type H+-transporting ATPase subunit b
LDNPLVRPDPGLFIWTIVTFLVLLGLLTRYAWRPLLVALQARQDRIRQALEEAKAASEERERLQRESADIIRRARVEADAIVSASRADADRLRDEARHKARGDAAAIVAAAERQIQLDAVRARQELRQEAVDLSIAIASKLIRRNLRPEDNQMLIDEVIGTLGRQH